MVADVHKYFHDNQTKKVMRAVVTSVFGAADTVKTFTVETSALLLGLKPNIPNWTNIVTLTIALTEADGATLFSEAAIVRDTKAHIVPVYDSVNWAIPLDGIITVTLTLSGAPGGTGGNVVTTLYLG